MIAMLSPREGPSFLIHTLFVLFLLVPRTGTAEKPDIRFDHYTIQNGLSQSTVNCIIQDPKGMIWIGTQDGLNRFNGYEFTVYQKDPLDSGSISDNFIHSLALGPEGHVLVGSENGLDRYRHRTGSFHSIPFEEGFDPVVQDLERDGEGNVWIATQDNGIHVLKKDSGVARSPGMSNKGSLSVPTSVRTLRWKGKDSLWVGTSGKGLFLYCPERGALFPTPIKEGAVHALHPISASEMWVGTDKGLFKLAREKGKIRILERIGGGEGKGKLPHPVVKAIHLDRKGRLWFGTAGGGLLRAYKKDGQRRFYQYQHQDYISSSLANDIVNTIHEDRTGSIWIGSRRGVSKFDPNKQFFQHITSHVLSEKGLNDKNVWEITTASENELWVGTRKGVTRFEREQGHYYHYDRPIERFPDVNDKSVLSLSLGEKIWAGCVDGLYRIELGNDPSTARYIKMPYERRKKGESVQRSKVYNILRGKDGILWLGTRTGLKRYDPQSGKLELFSTDSSATARLSHSLVRDVHKGSKGNLWIATDGGGLNRMRVIEKNGERSYELKVFERDPKQPNSLNTNSLMSIWEGSKGYLWLGTYGGGLNRFDPESGHVEHYTEKEGLPNNVVYGVLGDEKGNLWMSTNRGICRFDKEKEEFTVFEKSDGLQSDEFNIGAYHRSDSGEIFFGGINGLNAFHPSRLEKNPYPPEMVFTRLKLFNVAERPKKGGVLEQDIEETERIVLSPDQNNFTLEFAALHYSQPEKNRYRYLLEGFDKDTVEAGRDRSAHYTNLDPGTYTFKVWGCNSDGVWAQEPAELEILVERPYWATWWFRGLGLLVLAGSGFGAYRYRVNLIEGQKRKLEMEVRRRTQEVTQQKERIEEQNKLLEEEKEKVEEQRSLLEEEKNKVDKLLVNLLPEDTANELKTGGRASARHYRMATVMFTDFKGFTKIAEQMKATELVARLDSYFIKFDQIIERWELEKIKTIGDAYMCAGGIPIRNKTNPIHTVLAGMEIQRYMQKQRNRLENKDEDHWELRIGIHTGELIAGVIGIKRYAYDIWGDTVNVAARMESNGEVGKVNISGSTYSYIEPFFECTYRGKVHAKNKGHIDMFFVDRIKPELSVDGKGEEPNEAFWEYMNLHFFSKINYRKAEKALLKKLRKELPENLYYHDVRHTEDVCQAVERLAFMEGIEGEDLFLLKTAALFHDAGFVEQYENNEWIGARMAKEMLPNYGYTEEQLDQVASMIHATQVPPKPKNHLEEIICDADLDYLGREDFHEIADKLRKELMERGKIQSMIEWDRLQVSFLREHHYFTESAINLRRKKKLEHLREIEERLAKMEAEANEQGPAEE